MYGFRSFFVGFKFVLGFRPILSGGWLKTLIQIFFYEWGVKSLNLAAWGKLFG